MTRAASQSAEHRSEAGFASSARAELSLQSRADLILACARSLYVNGQSTSDILAAVARLAGKFGLESRFSPRWGELRLEVADHERSLVHATTAEPTAVNMARVASTMRLIEALVSGRMAPSDASGAIAAAARTPPAPLGLFALAAAAGAVAMGVLFGLDHARPPPCSSG